MMSQIWENYVEGEEVVNGSSKVETRQKETLKVNLAVLFVLQVIDRNVSFVFV